MIDGRRHEFGVSGKLLNDNVLMYDRQTESLWSQILMQAVTGPMTGTPLETIPLENTRWEDWKRRHPETLVLSLNTGYNRPYMRDPYRIADGGALVVFFGGEVKIYPLSELDDVKDLPLRDEVGNQTVLIHFDEENENAWATDEDGAVVDSFTSYERAITNFFPQSEVFEAKK